MLLQVRDLNEKTLTLHVLSVDTHKRTSPTQCSTVPQQQQFGRAPSKNGLPEQEIAKDSTTMVSEMLSSIVTQPTPKAQLGSHSMPFAYTTHGNIDVIGNMEKELKSPSLYLSTKYGQNSKPHCRQELKTLETGTNGGLIGRM